MSLPLKLDNINHINNFVHLKTAIIGFLEDYRPFIVNEGNISRKNQINKIILIIFVVGFLKGL